MSTKKKTVTTPAVDCSLVRVEALEAGLRAATAMRKAIIDKDPFGRFLDLPREAVEAYDQTITELKKKVRG